MLGKQKIKRGNECLEMLHTLDGYKTCFFSLYYPGRRDLGGLPVCSYPGLGKRKFIFGELHHRCTSSHEDEIAVIVKERRPESESKHTQSS